MKTSLSRFRVGGLLIVALAAITVARLVPAKPPAADVAVSPDQALQWLKEGNERYVAGKADRPNSSAERRVETARNGQSPFAAVLACADSRAPVELLFDRGIGDLFVVRVAGNVADTTEVASIEYGADHLGIPLVVVLGHTHCGAVKAATGNVAGNGPLPQLLDRIKPAVESIRREHPDISDADLIPAATRANVRKSIADLLKASDTVRKLSEAGKLKLVGGVYDIETGRIEWLSDK